MIKPSILKKVISGVLVLSTVCVFSMVSCFAGGGASRVHNEGDQDGEKDFLSILKELSQGLKVGEPIVKVGENINGSGLCRILISEPGDGFIYLKYLGPVDPVPGGNNVGGAESSSDSDNIIAPLTKADLNYK